MNRSARALVFKSCRECGVPLALRNATGGLADVVVDGTRGWGSDAPGFSPDAVVYKELNIVGALGVDTPAYRAALELLASERYPFAVLPRRCVGLDGAAELLATMGGERDDVPPVHGVLTP